VDVLPSPGLSPLAAGAGSFSPSRLEAIPVQYTPDGKFRSGFHVVPESADVQLLPEGDSPSGCSAEASIAPSLLEAIPVHVSWTGNPLLC